MITVYLQLKLTTIPLQAFTSNCIKSVFAYCKYETNWRVTKHNNILKQSIKYISRFFTTA